MTANYFNWHEMLPYALMSYRTLIRGMEAVLPIEVKILSLPVLAEVKIPESA